MSCGAVVAAPAVVLSLVLDLDLTATSLLIAMPAVVYTMFGGVQAVTWTDVKIMVLVVFGLFAIIVAAVAGYPSDVSIADGLRIAGATGRLRIFDFSFDLTNQYTFWSGTIAALFLFCSYFGTDQSQVQRFLTARSVNEARSSLLMSAYWKIPLQASCSCWACSFRLPRVQRAAAHLQQRCRRPLEARAPDAYAALRQEHDAAIAARLDAARRFADAGDDAAPPFGPPTPTCSRSAAGAGAHAPDDRRCGFDDVNYIIPGFILEHLPVGLVGLLILAILLAATDTIAGELNSLSTATVIDFYRRWVSPVATDAHYLTVSRIATGVWGFFACWSPSGPRSSARSSRS